MFFPISNAHINPIYLVVVGFIIGILGGFFGVGGSFIAGPALRLMGVDWNYAVGTDLAHIVGKSIVAAKQHRALGNVDLKLGSIMAFGTIGGAECGILMLSPCDTVCRRPSDQYQSKPSLHEVAWPASQQAQGSNLSVYSFRASSVQLSCLPARHSGQTAITNLLRLRSH